MPTIYPLQLPPDPGSGFVDDPTAGPHKPGGGGLGPYNQSLGGFGSFGQGIGYGQQGFNPFTGAAGFQQRRRPGMYSMLAPDPAAQFAQIPQSSQMQDMRAPQASMQSGGGQTGGPSAPVPQAPPQIGGGWGSIGDLLKRHAAAGGGGGGTPANDVDMILAGLGQGQWSWAGDPAARQQLAQQAYAHAKDMEQSSLLGAQIDTTDPWMRSFARTQGRLQGQRQAGETLRNYDTDQIDYVKNLAAQLFMAKLGQYYQQQNKPKQGGIGNILGDVLGTGVGALAGGYGKALGGG